MDSAFGWLRSRLLHGTHFLSDTGTLRLLHGTHFHSVGGTLDFKARTVYSAFCRWLSQFLHSVDTLDFFTASALLIYSWHVRWFLYSIGGTLDLFMAHATALDSFTARSMVSVFHRRHSRFVHGTCDCSRLSSRHMRWFLCSIGGTLDLFMAHAIALDFLHSTRDGFCILSAALRLIHGI
jgi:hypothetical protein